MKYCILLAFLCCAACPRRVVTITTSRPLANYWQQGYAPRYSHYGPTPSSEDLGGIAETNLVYKPILGAIGYGKPN